LKRLASLNCGWNGRMYHARPARANLLRWRSRGLVLTRSPTTGSPGLRGIRRYHLRELPRYCTCLGRDLLSRCAAFFSYIRFLASTGSARRVKSNAGARTERLLSYSTFLNNAPPRSPRSAAPLINLLPFTNGISSAFRGLYRQISCATPFNSCLPRLRSAPPCLLPKTHAPFRCDAMASYRTIYIHERSVNIGMRRRLAGMYCILCDAAGARTPRTIANVRALFAVTRRTLNIACGLTRPLVRRAFDTLHCARTDCRRLPTLKANRCSRGRRRGRRPSKRANSVARSCEWWRALPISAAS